MPNLEDNRVLSRRGARMMTEDETTMVNGGLHTETKCSFDPRVGIDGDAFTNDCIAH